MVQKKKNNPNTSVKFSLTTKEKKMSEALFIECLQFANNLLNFFLVTFLSQTQEKDFLSLQLEKVSSSTV